MKLNVLVTGATGYIGKRLIRLLLSQGHNVIACVRDINRFSISGNHADQLKVLEADLLYPSRNFAFPVRIDVAFYLVHSMSSSLKSFEIFEKQAAGNFVRLINQTNTQQIIYLGGIISSDHLSKHLRSRKRVGEILSGARAQLTTLRAGIIIGSGSASFEIIRDLVEKLPVMITPKWLNTRCQPIAVRNVIDYLAGVMLKPETYGATFDIGGPDILTYKEMLLKFAEVRKLKRLIVTVPVLTPRLSSYWLYFITSVTYKLAVNLVDSMYLEFICQNDSINNIVQVELFDYKKAVEFAFQSIEQNHVLSSWKDALISSSAGNNLNEFIEVPQFGCYKDTRSVTIDDPERVIENIWSIGGEHGWYYANWLWRVRGFLDKVAGGVGLRRGRTNISKIETGDALDFWRVLSADKERKRLLLYAEMKLPGEAWLEFRINEKENMCELEQIATFRPKGLMGRFYWFLLYPLHMTIFKGMVRNIANY